MPKTIEFFKDKFKAGWLLSISDKVHLFALPKQANSIIPQKTTPNVKWFL